MRKSIIKLVYKTRKTLFKELIFKYISSIQSCECECNPPPPLSAEFRGHGRSPHDLARRFFKKFGNKWNPPDRFPINGIQAIFHEFKGNRVKKN
jgi:hypothetical protein